MECAVDFTDYPPDDAEGKAMKHAVKCAVMPSCCNTISGVRTLKRKMGDATNTTNSHIQFRANLRGRLYGGIPYGACFSGSRAETVFDGMLHRKGVKMRA